MGNFKCGLVSISFRNHTSEELVKAVSEAGLDAIEWGSDVHAPYADIEKLENIVNLQKEYNVECSSYGTYFYLGRDDIALLPEYIKAAKILGTDILRLWCGVKGSESYTDEEKEELFEICRKASKIAEKENVRFCMECHAGTYPDTPESAVELMKAVNSPNFKMFWQPNQHQSVEYNEDFAKKVLPFAENVHVFYWEGIERFPLEKGKEDWRKYLDILGGKRYLLLEFLYDDKLTSLKGEGKTLLEIAGR